MTTKTRMAFVGGGGFARHNMRALLQQTDTTQVAAICEPDAAQYAESAQLFTQAGLPAPTHVRDFQTLLAKHARKLDAVYILTPHARHHDQAKAALEAGLDVLVEKPMVISGAEARSLIETRDRTGRLLVVAFQGSLSPQIRKAVQMLRAGELGELLTINGLVWQNWNALVGDSWRADPVLSGGGFLFDTGAHMLNTVSDLVGEDFSEVSAWLDNRGRRVEILGAVLARTRSGVLVTINGCGDAIPGCASEIRVFGTKGILHTGMWGERLALQKAGRQQARAVPVAPSLGVWEQFLKIRRGEMTNSSPPEIGLRMARFWDAIRASAAQGGTQVRVGD